MYHSIAKSTSAPTLESKRKKSSQGIGKSGDKYNMSATADDKANKYLGDVDNRMPEKMKVTEHQGRNKKVQESRSGKNQAEEQKIKHKDKIRKTSTLELDTGWVDVGYERKIETQDERESKERYESDKKDSPSNDDKPETNEEKVERTDDKSDRNDEKSPTKKMQLLTSVQGGLTEYDEKHAIERYNRYQRTDLSAKVGSTDESYQTGAVYQKHDASRMPESVAYTERRQWEVFSNRIGNEGTYDRVMPFHDFNQKKETNKLKSLEQERNEGNDKTSAQKGITEVTNLKNTKESMRRYYDKKMEHEIRKAQREMTQMDDIIFHLKRLFARNLEELRKLLNAAEFVVNTMNQYGGSEIPEDILAKFNECVATLEKHMRVLLPNMAKDKDITREDVFEFSEKILTAGDFLNLDASSEDDEQ